MRYRRKSLMVDAEQWFEVTYDREPGVNTTPIYHLDVGYYRTPDLDGQSVCKHCQFVMHDHGWIDTHDGGRVVCPGDRVITEVNGEKYPCNDELFRATYEAEEPHSPTEMTTPPPEKEKEKDGGEIPVAECLKVISALEGECLMKRANKICLTCNADDHACRHTDVCGIAFAIEALNRWKNSGE